MEKKTTMTFETWLTEYKHCWKELVGLVPMEIKFWMDDLKRRYFSRGVSPLDAAREDSSEYLCE